MATLFPFLWILLAVVALSLAAAPLARWIGIGWLPVFIVLLASAFLAMIDFDSIVSSRAQRLEDQRSRRRRTKFPGARRRF